jgi:trans-aconitate 3-methyltransferase
MSQSTPNPTPFQTEKTFRSYNEEQGKAYAQNRRDYHPSLYQTIFDYHTSSGGQLDTVLDVGCGPGTIGRGLDVHFTRVICLDPSEGMISTARSLHGEESTAGHIRFEISTAEELGANLSPPIEDSSVDLITAANSAHWFDMSGFWPRAARVLKPGGTVAMWAGGELRTHPSMPNAAAIQAAMDKHFEQYLKEFEAPGNVLTRNRYVGLPLPWTLVQPVPEFDEGSFFRKDWDGTDNFVGGLPEADLDTFEKAMSTASPVTRWRQANPDAVGTERDVVRILRREIERLLHEAGVEEGKETAKGYVTGTLLMLKKKM